MILDLHTHHPAPQPEGVISVNPVSLPTQCGQQLYSIGIHPWEVKMPGITPAERLALEKGAERADVAAIGECGIDIARPGATPLFAQLIAFKAHVEISERTGKPLILHCVKAWDVIIGVRKDLNAKQPWIVHGFRGKPSILEMLLKAGISVSYGEKFNPESLLATPAEQLYAETDESSLPIADVIASLATVRPEITRDLINANTTRLLNQHLTDTNTGQLSE